MTTALNLFIVLLVAITVAPLLPSKHWVVRVWEFPRLQIAALIFIALVAKAWTFNLADADGNPLYDYAALACLLLTLLYQLKWIIPYTLFYKREVHREKAPNSDNTISILSSNVFMPNDNYDALLTEVEKHKPDFLVMLESNKRWEENVASIEGDYPYTKHCPLENLYGMHLYSKYPFSEVSLRFLIEDDVPSIRLTFTKNNQTVTLFFLHPKPPSPTENETAGPRDAELLLVGKEVANIEGPVIVAGDLNDVAWSPTTRKFKQISGLLDPRIGRAFYNTFHAHYPLIKWPLDHVFHSNHFDLVHVKKLPDIGSDHFPLLTVLSLKKTKG